MISLFKKLQNENLLKQNGLLLDLGCGNGKVSEPFFNFGYSTVLVDSNADILVEADKNFSVIKKDGYTTVNDSIEKFEFQNNYDGIIISNVLSFQKDKAEVARIIQSAFEKLNKNGFLYFTLFGLEDDWAKTEVHKDRMTFYTKDEALAMLPEKPYFVSEDQGKGLTMKGDIKTWHVFYLLYIK